MRFLKYLEENYLGIYKYAMSQTEVYENPKPNEIRSMPPVYQASKTFPEASIRFIAHAPTKEIFVWAADGGVHCGVFSYLKKKGKLKNAKHIVDTGLCSGYASPAGDKMTFERGYGFGVDIFKGDMYKHEWDWLSQYFRNMDKVRQYTG